MEHVVQTTSKMGAMKRLLHTLAIFGPGIIVMLANTDAGCIITAAQSGAQWGYAMVHFRS